MAISLGDAALAFAGGAAKQYNKMADEERTAKQKRQEQINNLLDQAAAKQAETEFTNQVNKHHKLESLYESFKTSGGPNSGLGQKAIADYYGWDLATVVRSGQFGTLSAPERMKSPIPLTDRILQMRGSEYSPEAIAYYNRTKNTTLSKKYTPDGRAIPRGVGVNENGEVPPTEYMDAHGIGLDEPAAWFQDLSDLDQEERDALGQALLGESDKEVKWDTDLKRWTVIDPKTLKAQIVEPEGLPEGTQGPSDTQLSKHQNDRVFWEGKLDDPDPKVRADATRRLAELDLRIDKEAEQVGRTEQDMALKLRNEKHISELRDRRFQMQNTSKLLDNYMKEGAAVTGGVAALTGRVKDAIVTNIRGISEYLGAVDPRTPSEMEAELGAAGFDLENIDSMDTGILQGMARFDKIQLIYGMASVFKEAKQRELNNKDLENAEKALSGFAGGKENLGALHAFQRNLKDKLYGLNSELYFSEGITPDEKMFAGQGMVEALGLEQGSGYFVMPDKNIYIPDTEGKLVPFDKWLDQYPQLRRR